MKLEDLPGVSGSAEKRRLIEESLKGVEAQLNWVSDALIPRDDELGMPSATDIGLVENYLASALAARDDLAREFVAAVGKLPAEKPSDPLAGAQSLLSEMEFDCVGKVIAGAYFYDSSVNETLGYFGQRALLETPDYDYIVEAAEKVISRGELYVPVS